MLMQLPQRMQRELSNLTVPFLFRLCRMLAFCWLSSTLLDVSVFPLSNLVFASLLSLTSLSPIPGYVRGNKDHFDFAGKAAPTQAALTLRCSDSAGAQALGTNHCYCFPKQKGSTCGRNSGDFAFLTPPAPVTCPTPDV